jgi:CheY-like chemotaxis protein
VANLLTNAARYTEPGGEIRLRAWRDGATQLAVSVRDNGVGIAADVLPRVFELFYQGQRGVDRAEGGLGIGLALVRSLVELHGGSVEARSAGRGRGSEFIVRLPWSEPAAAAGAGQGSGAQDGVAAARILLVDDNRDAAETLAELLRLHGLEVEVFADPVEALARGPAWRPDVAILDIGLPVMDGYELGAHLRKACGSACRFIALTGYGQDADRARSEAAGFSGHLVKPVAPQQLLAAIEAARRR